MPTIPVCSLSLTRPRFFLMFGKQVRLSVEIMYGLAAQEEEEINHFAERVREELRRAHDVVRNRMSARLLREKELYDHKLTL